MQRLRSEREIARAAGDLALAEQATVGILAGVATLKTSPISCRKAGQSPFLRELGILFDHSGDVALFEICEICEIFDPDDGVV